MTTRNDAEKEAMELAGFEKERYYIND